MDRFDEQGANSRMYSVAELRTRDAEGLLITPKYLIAATRYCADTPHPPIVHQDALPIE
jgi:hypothetical protein